MAAPSRLYLPPSGGTPGITPTQAAEWDFFTGFTRAVPALTKTNTAFANKAQTDATATANRDALTHQFVYPLVTGTVFATSQTIKGRVLALEGAAASNLRSQAIVRVIGSDGTTVRATLYAGDVTTGTTNPTSEWATAATNRQMPRGTTVAVAANYTTVAGDYLVIEIGYRKHAAASTVGTVRLGDNNAADLAENETATTDANTWIEFSGDLDPNATVPKAGTDSFTPATAETGALAATAAGVDSFTPDTTEIAALAATAAGTDGIGVALSESGSVAITEPKASSDSVSVSVAEVGTLAATAAATDSIAPTTAETAGLAATTGATDSLTVATTEIASVVATTPQASSDTLALAVADAASLAASGASADTTAIATDESAVLAAVLAATDAFSVTLAESASVEVVPDSLSKSSSDSVTIVVVDLAIGVGLAASDALAFTLVEFADVVMIAGEPTVPLVVGMAPAVATTGVAGSQATGTAVTIGSTGIAQGSL